VVDLLAHVGLTVAAEPAVRFRAELAGGGYAEILCSPPT
jgi:hypothetical protein